MTKKTETSLNKKVLIVDDDHQIARAISCYISEFADVVVADSGNAAIEIIKENSFDTIITDYKMNNGNGLYLLEWLKNNEYNIPVVMVTGQGTKDLLIKAVRYHLFDFIEKPFNVNEIIDKVKASLKLKERDDHLNKMKKFGEIAGHLIHEIVNPLFILDLKAQALSEISNELGNEEIKTTVSKILEYSEKIKRLIEVTKTNLRSKTCEIFVEPINVSKLFSEVKEICFEKLKTSGVQLKIDDPGKNLEVKADKGMMIQALSNLLNNAVDAVAGKEKPWVCLSVETNSENLSFLVTDSGAGIPEELR